MHQQHECNSFFFSSSGSVFVVLEELITKKLISMRITASFTNDSNDYKDKSNLKIQFFLNEIKKVSSVYIIDCNNERKYAVFIL